MEYAFAGATGVEDTDAEQVRDRQGLLARRAPPGRPVAAVPGRRRQRGRPRRRPSTSVLPISYVDRRAATRSERLAADADAEPTFAGWESGVLRDQRVARPSPSSQPRQHRHDAHPVGRLAEPAARCRPVTGGDQVVFKRGSARPSGRGHASLAATGTETDDRHDPGRGARTPRACGTSRSSSSPRACVLGSGSPKWSAHRRAVRRSTRRPVSVVGSLHDRGGRTCSTSTTRWPAVACSTARASRTAARPR